MTNEQIFELVEKNFSFIAEYSASGWIAETEDILKFARAIYDEGYKEGRYEESYHNSIQ